MAKRVSGTPNTLLNYFSPKVKKSNNENSINKANLQNATPTKLTNSEKRSAQSSSDDDEPVHATKRRRRIIEASSDSDSEGPASDTNTKTNGSKPSKKLLNFFNNGPSTVKSENGSSSVKSENDSSSVKSERLSKNGEVIDKPTKNGETEYKPPKNEENDESTEQNVQWLHERLDFLQPDQIRDINRHRPNDPNYDSRTLHVPKDFLFKQTPAMKQWWEIKSTHYDCVLFFKVGKFYELYHMDAVTGVNQLALQFMKGEFAHSGFPEIAYGRFASSLVELGYKVVRVEQTETPDMLQVRLASSSGPKPTKFDRVVRREVCQITSRATRVANVQDQAPPQFGVPEYLVALYEQHENQGHREFGVCFVNTAVASFQLCQFTDDQYCSRLLTLLAEYPPATILEERSNLHPDTKQLLKASLGNIVFESLAAKKEFYTAQKTIEVFENETYLKNHGSGEVNWPPDLKDMIFEDGVLVPNGRPEYKLALQCLGAIHFFLKICLLDIQLFSMGNIKAYKLPAKEEQPRFRHMILDANALRNLQILDGEHSLQSTLDRCSSAGGKRLIRQWICRPLYDAGQIRQRQEAVSELVGNYQLLQEIVQQLAGLPDIEHEISKIHAFGNYVRSRTHPDSRAIFYEENIYSKRKIIDFLTTLEAVQKCCDIVKLCNSLESHLIVRCSRQGPKGQFPDIKDTLKYFMRAFDHDEAKKAGKIIPRQGIDEEYDETVEKLNELKVFGENYLKEQSRHFGCKVKYFGKDKKRFMLEVPEPRATDRANDDYQLEGARKGSDPCKRFTTAVTRKLLADMMAAEKTNKEIIQDLNRKIWEKFGQKYDQWMALCNCMATLDCLASLALYASSQSVETCVPEILPKTDDGKAVYDVEEGIHPFMPHVEHFIPNNILLGGENNPPLIVITGANMAGKTTLMRQTALLGIMAQIGSVVPARSMRLTPIDRVFTRLGARDDIAASQSTFHVEMAEALAMLKHATRDSVMLIDELGRGTSTHDGSAIAAAYVHQLAQLHCRTVFSTHYHVVMTHCLSEANVRLCHMACRVEDSKDEEDITFMYKMREGACPRSYGYNAAKLAGLPRSITERSREISNLVESNTLIRKMFVLLFSKQNDVSDLLTSFSSLQF